MIHTIDADPDPTRAASQPRVTRDYFHRIPKRALDHLTKAEQKVYLHVLENADPDEFFHGTNASIAKATGLHVGTVIPIITKLATDHPPGIDHPYFHVEGGTRTRRIRVLYRPKDRSDQNPPIRMKNHSNPPAIRMKNHSNRRPEPPHCQGIAALSLFPDSGERENVNVELILGRSCAHARARDPVEPVAGLTPPVTPIVTTAQLLAPPLPVVTAPAEPVPATPPPVLPAPVPLPPMAPDGIDPELAGLSDDQLRDRVAAQEAEVARQRARGARQAALSVWVKLVAAKALLEAREGPAQPPVTPQVRSIAPQPAAASLAKPAPSKPPIQGLADRVRRVAGPEPIETLARRLSEELKDPGSIAFYQQVGCDIRAGKLDPARVWAAYRQAKSPTARSPGAIFTAFIRRLE
jgi:hypothetical protein